MWVKTIASRVLRAFAEERRRIISDWRVLLVCRDLARVDNTPLPDQAKADAVVLFLLRRGDIAPVERATGVYRIDSPFASVIPVSDEQIVQEANPWAVFSFLTALGHHGLTNAIPRYIQATNYEHPVADRCPLGTRPEEWLELDLPRARQPKRVGDVAIQWTRMNGAFDFGHTISYVHGLPIYVTDVERTLLDAIRAPGKVGGIREALEAWREASLTLNVDKLVNYAARFESPVLRQRVGFLLERLGHSHPRLEEWRESLQRGGSLKLVASAPYAATFSERWNLSLNVPESILVILGD